MSDNLFEIAARRKYRFDTVRGAVMVEHLFDVPLISRNGFDLDTIARTVNADLKAVTEESFVATTANTGQADLERKLEIVKFVIADKIEAKKAAEARVEKAEKRRKLLDALETKENQELSSASKEDILKQLEELEA